MNEQELRELALKITNLELVKIEESAMDDFPDEETAAFVVAFTRAAVAHGLRMGVDLCNKQWHEFAWPDMTRHCANIIRAKADELESGK